MRRLRRGGTYYRVCDPGWKDCGDTSFNRVRGGRWNPPGEFGALYLNRTLEVAAAQARWNFRGEALGLFDLRPEQRPDFQEFEVEERLFVNAVTEKGLSDLGLPPRFPYRVEHRRCRRIGRRHYGAGERGIASRSAAECDGPGRWVGEELVLFDREADPIPATPGVRTAFDGWYPPSR